MIHISNLTNYVCCYAKRLKLKSIHVVTIKFIRKNFIILKTINDSISLKTKKAISMLLSISFFGGLGFYIINRFKKSSIVDNQSDKKIKEAVFTIYVDEETLFEVNMEEAKLNMTKYSEGAISFEDQNVFYIKKVYIRNNEKTNEPIIYYNENGEQVDPEKNYSIVKNPKYEIKFVNLNKVKEDLMKEEIQKAKIFINLPLHLNINDPGIDVTCTTDQTIATPDGCKKICIALNGLDFIDIDTGEIIPREKSEYAITLPLSKKNILIHKFVKQIVRDVKYVCSPLRYGNKRIFKKTADYCINIEEIVSKFKFLTKEFLLKHNDMP